MFLPHWGTFNIQMCNNLTLETEKILLIALSNPFLPKLWSKYSKEEPSLRLSRQPMLSSLPHEAYTWLP